MLTKMYSKFSIILFILVLSALLRFYRAEQLFVFSGDEEHQMSIAYSLVKHFHIEWVGVSSADTGFYLGPFWVYFGALWLKLSQGNPAILAYVAASIGVLTTLIVYLLGKTIYDKTVANLVAFIYATSPLLIFYDKKFWNPSLTALASTSLLLTTLLTRKSKYWWLIVWLIYGLIFHIHLSLVPLGIFVIYYFIRDFRKLGLKLILFSTLIFFITTSPIILFDYFTKGENLLTPFRIAKQVSDRPSRFQPFVHIENLAATLSRIWYIDPYTEAGDQVLHSCSPLYATSSKFLTQETTSYTSGKLLFGIFSILILVIFHIKKFVWQNYNSRLLILFIDVLLISYLLLPNIPLEYYLLGFLPLFLIVSAAVITNLQPSLKKLSFIAIVILSGFGIYTIFTTKDNFGLTQKKMLIEDVSSIIGNSPYELQIQGICHKYEGWRFLSKAYWKAPVKSVTDSTLGWIYKEELSLTKPQYTVLYKESRDPSLPPPKYSFSFYKGGFSAFIYKL